MPRGVDHTPAMTNEPMPDIYQTFRRFLRENGCERQFDAAFHEQCGANVLDETLSDILAIDEGFSGRVFRWDLTAEGREFWKDIDKKWLNKFGTAVSTESSGIMSI